MDGNSPRQARHAGEADGSAAVSSSLPIHVPFVHRADWGWGFDDSAHLSNLKPNIDNGFFVMGGASLDEPIKEGEGPKINGSVMMAVADSKEEVLEELRKDIYATSGVWDVEKVSSPIAIWVWLFELTLSQVQIFPFKSAIRKAM